MDEQEYTLLKKQVITKKGIENKIKNTIEYSSALIAIASCIIIGISFNGSILGSVMIFVLLLLGFAFMVWIVSFKFLSGLGLIFLKMNKEVKLGKIAEEKIKQYEKQNKGEADTEGSR